METKISFIPVAMKVDYKKKKKMKSCKFHCCLQRTTTGEKAQKAMHTFRSRREGGLEQKL